MKKIAFYYTTAFILYTLLKRLYRLVFTELMSMYTAVLCSKYDVGIIFLSDCKSILGLHYISLPVGICWKVINILEINRIIWYNRKTSRKKGRGLWIGWIK